MPVVSRLVLPAGLVLGLALVPLRAMGPSLHRVPGDLVDARINHLQLATRFLVPVAFLLAVRLLHRPSARVAAGLAACLVWQFYCTIYVGFFLALTLAPFALAYAWMRRSELPWRQLAWRSVPD